MTIEAPNLACIWGNMARAMLSVDPPAGKVTTTVMGLSGQAQAELRAAQQTQAMKSDFFKRRSQMQTACMMPCSSHLWLCRW
jgi:hypothetical protein